MLDADLGQNLVHIGASELIRSGPGNVADVQDDIGLAHFIQGGPEGFHQFVRQVGDEADGVGDYGRPAPWQVKLAEGRVQGGEQHRLGQDVGVGQAVEQGRLAGIGVADQGDGRVRHALARQPLQAARTAHVGQLGLELDDAVDQQPPVGLDLGLARATQEAEAALADAPGGSRCAPGASAS